MRPMSDDYKYWAFISYSHHDTRWAEWLHKLLETYRVPGRLVGKAGQLGAIPKRLYPVFRDRDELPGSADLGALINRALEQSRYLIVICSPRAAGSRYVNEEVRLFKAMGRANRVLCLIVDGEPNASDQPGAAGLECFPAVARFEVGADGQLTDRRVEPIAADAREGRDGRANASLKIIAGLLEVGFDDLRQRERARLLRRRIAIGLAAVAGVMVVALSYVLMADGDMRVPAGESIRLALDRQGISVFRAPHSEARIAAEAKALRTHLAMQILDKGENGQFRWGGTNFDIWTTAQALTSILYAPDLERAIVERAVKAWQVAFEAEPMITAGGVRFGWRVASLDYTQSESTFWASSLISRVLERPALLGDAERRRYRKWLDAVVATTDVYYPVNDGGWNMLPRQTDPSLHSHYSSVLALQALLDLRRAGLPWKGSAEQRDALIARTFDWLVMEHRLNPGGSGWLGYRLNESTIPLEGLSLQIYGTLFRAAQEMQLAIPRDYRDHVYEYLVRMPGRPFNPNRAAGTFRIAFVPHQGQSKTIYSPVNFLWYPWAIECAMRWLVTAEQHREPAERVTRMRRALGYLVVDLRDSMITETKKEAPYMSSEILIALSLVPAATAK